MHVFITQGAENSVAFLLSMKTALILVSASYMCGNVFEGQMNAKNVKLPAFLWSHRYAPNLADEVLRLFLLLSVFKHFSFFCIPELTERDTNFVLLFECS